MECSRSVKNKHCDDHSVFNQYPLEFTSVNDGNCDNVPQSNRAFWNSIPNFDKKFVTALGLVGAYLDTDIAVVSDDANA